MNVDLDVDELRLLQALAATSAVGPDRYAKALADKLAKALDIAESANGARPNNATLCFALSLPLRLAPTMNTYAATKGWEKAKLRREVDMMIMIARSKWPQWSCGAREVARLGRAGHFMKEGGRRRRVEVVRYSSQRPDESSVDAIGGKVPIDRMVRANVLRDDNAEWLDRAASWEHAPRDEGRFVVRVFDLT